MCKRRSSTFPTTKEEAIGNIYAYMSMTRNHLFAKLNKPTANSKHTFAYIHINKKYRVDRDQCT